MAEVATNDDPTHQDRESLPVGVYRTTWGNRFFVQIRHKRVLYYLGTHETVEAAVEVRDAAREHLKQLA